MTSLDRPFAPETEAGLARHLPALVLFGVTFIWGASFLVIQTALAVSGPLFFQGLRYGIAALVLAAITLPRIGGLTRLEWWVGVCTGLAVAAANGLQAVGLGMIPSSTSAFLTALYVPMVPLAQWLFMRDPPRPLAWAGIALAFAGMVLLAGPGALHLDLGAGEAMTIASAAIIAAEIVAIGIYTKRLDSRRVALVQIVVIAVATFAAVPVAGEGVPAPGWLLLACAGGLGLGSVVIHLAMYWAQKRLSPTRATLIYATEPIWAGILGRLAGERLPALGLAGAGLIVASVVLNALRPAADRAAGRKPAPPDR
ncbi:DMT family transporter [Zavarzinia compransoris]|uniref:EamA family transporter n=1 Tax=Zavarzinia compransoris TaxID=1264899 RepID=A0A317EA64_9PROT|nr:DMT family transporter [Zavarzinia compransoris]PWR23601.1 EamA family transporter [Zavarzinia compransoris]TDP47818.1 threonine/homoserine efflux transporter RhtA [Zavarzinia compransoris]